MYYDDYYDDEKANKLEALKQRTIDLSVQRRQLKQAISDKEQESYELVEKEENASKEMFDLVNKMISSNRSFDIAEREKINNRLDRLNEYQRANNELLSNIDSNLKDTTSLEALYKAKRDELEYNYQEQEKVLQRRLNSLKSEIDQKTQELDQITKEKRLKNFSIRVLQVIIAAAAVILVILFIEWLGNGVSGFFGGIKNWFNGLFN